MSEILLVTCNDHVSLAEWRRLFDDTDLVIEVFDLDDHTVDPSRVSYVMCFNPSPGRIAQFHNLLLIISLGAGVDHLTRDPACPTTVPIVRMVTDETRWQMADYVAWASLSLLRDLPRMAHAFALQQWDHFTVPRTANQCRVGILGMGEMGQAAAQTLQRIGFQVSGWARCARDLPGIQIHIGESGLLELTESSDILICLLPAAPSLKGIIDRQLLQRLPAGAGLINVGRGDHLVEEDLVDALNAGALSGAILDVTLQEPLPKGSALWGHPNIFVTAHLASIVTPGIAVQFAAESVGKLKRGEALAYLFELDARRRRTQ